MNRALGRRRAMIVTEEAPTIRLYLAVEATKPLFN